MQIVALQYDIVWQEPEKNRLKISDLLKNIEIPKGSLIVLPEMHDVGFSMDVKKTAQTKERLSEVFLKGIAEKYKSCVVAGMVSEPIGKRAANECVAYAEDKDEIVRYRKMHPFSLSNEKDSYIAGDSQKTFLYNDYKITPLICYDLRFPEVFRYAAKEGTQIFTVIANWPAKRRDHWLTLLKARAIENQAYVVGVNRCGTDPKLDYSGDTIIFSPTGKCLAKLGDEEQVLVHEIDKESLLKLRESFPVLKDAVHLIT